eukprot:PhF_6_TR37446/c2_g1_i4/m.55042
MAICVGATALLLPVLIVLGVIFGQKNTPNSTDTWKQQTTYTHHPNGPEISKNRATHITVTTTNNSCAAEYKTALTNRSILFAGHCVARTMADTLRWHLDPSSKPNLNPRGHHVWIHNKTNTRIDHVFLHSSDMPESRLKSIKAVPYTDVVLTAGLWEMFSMDDVGTAYKEMVRYMTVIRDTFPTSRFIVMNNYHLAQARAVATMRHVCTTPDRQAAYRDIVACAASEVFNGTTSQQLFQYYDPAYLTDNEVVVAKYRSPDGIHYDRLSPIGVDLGRGIARGLCNLAPHPNDVAVCLPHSGNHKKIRSTPLQRIVDKHSETMRCHVACYCHGMKDKMTAAKLPEMCLHFYQQSRKQVSMRKCYPGMQAATLAAAFSEYVRSLEVCSVSSLKDRGLCYDHESVTLPSINVMQDEDNTDEKRTPVKKIRTFSPKKA